MRKGFLTALFEAAFILTAVCGCSKPETKEGRKLVSAPLTLSPRFVEDEYCPIDKSMNVRFNSVNAHRRGTVSVDTEEQYNNGLIDLHVEVLPLYVFEGNLLSGDYYAVRGYVVAHNGESFSERLLPTHSYVDDYVKMYGWYMDKLSLSFQLLSPDGCELNQDQMSFFVSPEPSTTIGATTYRKGFSFSLGVTPLNLGKARVQEPNADPSWKTIALGCVSLGFKWEDSSTQELPDQGVEMYTDPYNRMVTYNFISNNIGSEFGPGAIPTRFRTDQRVDFSFVWHVPANNFCARDGDFGAMKMKVKLVPQFKADIVGNINYTSEELGYLSLKGVKSDCNSLEFVSDLPAMNRIPTGNINFKNTTRSYATNIRIWRAGEFDLSKEPYASFDSTLDTNDEVSCLVRAGTYDFVYELVNGDTGESRGLFAVKDITLGSGAELDISTLNGKRIQ